MKKLIVINRREHCSPVCSQKPFYHWSMHQERNVNLSYQYGTHQVCWYMHTDRWMRDWNDGDQMAHFFFLQSSSLWQAKRCPALYHMFCHSHKIWLKTITSLGFLLIITHQLLSSETHFVIQPQLMLDIL